MIREFHQISLRGRNSFGVDQRAARLVEFETAEDLRTFFAAGIPGRWTVLAGGNNILFTEDYDGVLLTPVATATKFACASRRASNGTTWWNGPSNAVCGASKTSR